MPTKDLNVAEECETMTSNAGICCRDSVGISVGLHEVPLAESVTISHGSTHTVLAAELWPTSAFSLVLFSENCFLQTMPHSDVKTSEKNLLFPLLQQ